MGKTCVLLQPKTKGKYLLSATEEYYIMFNFILLHLVWVVIAVGILFTFVFGSMLKERDLNNHNASRTK